MGKFCANCGKELTENAKFCSGCENLWKCILNGNKQIKKDINRKQA